MPNILILCAFSFKRSTRVGGGHARSLAITARELSRNNLVSILQIGDFIPDPISIAAYDCDINLTSIRFPKLRPLSIIRQISAEATKRQIDIILCFDHKLYAMCSGVFGKAKVILMKCGGPNPNTLYYPHPANVICYSDEDFNWFKRERPATNVAVIPNRSYRPQQDQELIRQIKEKLPGRVVMRICRIDGTYDWTVLQAARLASYLNKSAKTHLLIVGQADSPERIENLRVAVSTLHDSVMFLTDDQYTREASKLIDAADIVLGAGRSFMEAAGRGKVMFMPQKGQDFPVFVREDWFLRCFRINFSGRSDFTKAEIRIGLSECSSLLSDDTNLQNYRRWILTKFEEEFSAEAIPEKFNEFFTSAIVSQFSLRDSILAFAMLYAFLMKAR